MDLAGLAGPDGHLAMADVQSVPAGKYGKAALENLGVWDSVAGKSCRPRTCALALAFVARGEAPAGIVYATDAAAEPAVKVIGTFPADSHPPILYPVAMTADSTNAGREALLRLPAHGRGQAGLSKAGLHRQSRPGS